MAYSLTSLVDKVRQTLGGAVAQAPKTLSGLGDRVSSNFNWAGQQAQQGAASLGKTLSQGLNTFDKGVTSLSNNPNPLVNFMPKAITSAANANIKYQQAVQSKPVTFSKSGLQNYIDQQRLKLDAGLKTASPVLDVALAPTVGAATYLGSAGIGAVFGAGSQIYDNVTNKRNPFENVAQSAGYGAQQGLVQAPKISTIAGITNPVINQAAGKVLAKFPKLSEVGKAIVNRVVQGTLSVPEGIAMAKATGQDYNLTNAAIDFAVGSGLAKKAGTMAIEGPYGNGESGMVGNSKSIHPEDYKLYDSANTVIHQKGKFTPAEISKATNDLRVLGEKYLPISDQPANGNPILLANRLTARMSKDVLATPGEVGAANLNAKIDSQIFNGKYEKGDIGKIQNELETLLGVPSDAGFKQKQSLVGQNFAMLNQAADAGMPGATEDLARAKELFSAIELAQKGKAAGVEAKLNEPIGGKPQGAGETLARKKLEFQSLVDKLNTEKARLDKIDPNRQVSVMGDSLLTSKDYNRMQDLGGEISRLEDKARGISSNTDLKEIVQLKRNLTSRGVDFNSKASKQELQQLLDRATGIEPVVQTPSTGVRSYVSGGNDRLPPESTNNSIPYKNNYTTTPQVEPIGKSQPEVKTQPEILPWETPEYLAKNPSPAGTQPQSVAPSKLKQELNRPVAEANPKSTSPSITPELFTDIQSTGKAIDRKINLLDYLRTPDRVLEKIGLKKQSDGVKQAYNAYLDELPKQIDKITGWYEQTKADPNSAQKLFQYLDGNKSIQLDPTQQKVAGEMRQYLDQWAERLNLPVENRMANYMTHIFEKDFIQKEFDPELAKIIQDKIPGSVYDPFLQQRLGKLGYVEDAFRALDAYTKRAVRKANMDPALEKLKLSSESLDLQSWNYVKSYADRINLRPTELDNLFDNAIKQSPIGYKLGQRPVTAVSRTLRQMVYRGTLGLNVGSALRNLTQGANTYAQLGEKYTGIGYVKALKEIATGGDELLSSGVLRDNVVQDRQLSAVKGVMEKLDSGLFSFFNFAEKINRGAAYFGAKAKYLSEGASETEAIKKAVDLTRKTQFTFGSVDTPVAMQSDLVKTFSQFQSFNMKQTEFLAEMVKNKEFTGIIRYVGANLLLMATVGQLIGMKVEDMIPFSGVLTGQTKLGQTPPVKLAGDVVGALTNAPDKYGNISKDSLPARLGGVLMNNAPAFIPGGVQIKKTIQGLQAVKEGGSFSKTGKLQYPVPNDPITTTRAALFGKSNLPQAQKYFDSGATVLSDKQTQQFKDATDKQSAYDAVIKKRADAKIKKSTKAPTLKLKAPKKAKKTATKSASLKKIKAVKAPKPKKITIKKYKPKLISYKPLKLGKIKVSLT